MDTSTLVIGGGLSGLCTAYELAKLRIPFHLVEARDRLGGRILSIPVHADSSSAELAAIDLGPSWFWPNQTHIESLVDELGLRDSVYEQVYAGKTVLEYGDGSLQQSTGGASMAGSFRLDGGLDSLIQVISKQLPTESVALNTTVQSLRRTPEGVTAKFMNEKAQHQTISANAAVIAVPPRVIAQSINFDPALTASEYQQLQDTPTWMAAQAKFVATYSEAFWEQEGYSGDAMSQIGPLVEIHDASPRHGDISALFGFVGIPTHQRAIDADKVKSLAVDQLARLFGVKAKKPLAVFYKDWAVDAFTATGLDIDSPGSMNHSISPLSTHWDGALIWSGSETAASHHHSNGYLEGAVEAGLAAAHQCINTKA